MEVTKIDHIVPTVQAIEETKAFYQKVLGMESMVSGNGRVALKFGSQKLNLHESGFRGMGAANSVAPPKAVIWIFRLITTISITTSRGNA